MPSFCNRRRSGLMTITSTADPRVCQRNTLIEALPWTQLGWTCAGAEPNWQADDLVIYAVGRGLGHLTRALNIARLLGPATILHTADGGVPTPPPGVRLRRIEPDDGALDAALDAARMLIVDTFPAGLRGEVRPAHLAQVEVSVLIRRYLKTEAYPDYATSAGRYDCALRPYPVEGCEWEEDALDAPNSPLPGRCIGYLVRPLRRAVPSAGAGWSVMGRFDGLTAPIADALRQGDRIEGLVDALPDQPVVAVGAGYNTTYELLTSGLPFALVPVAKRFDDPWRRAARLGRAIHSRAALHAFIGLQA